MDDSSSSSAAPAFSDNNNNDNKKAWPVYVGACVYAVNLMFSVVFFAGNHLCSLAEKGDMHPFHKFCHVLFWTTVVSLGMTIIVTILAGLSFQAVMYCIPNDAEAKTAVFNAITKHSWSSVGSMFLISSLVTTVTAALMSMRGLSRPFQAIETVMVVAAIQVVALATWTAKM